MKNWQKIDLEQSLRKKYEKPENPDLIFKALKSETLPLFGFSPAFKRVLKASKC